MLAMRHMITDSLLYKAVSYCFHFSAGLDDNQRPQYWDDNVVDFYGNTNAGVSGMLLSFPYSIGYLSIAESVSSNIPFADIINKNVVQVMLDNKTALNKQ